MKPLLAVLAITAIALTAFAAAQALYESPSVAEADPMDAMIDQALSKLQEGEVFDGFYAVGYTDADGNPLKVVDKDRNFINGVTGLNSNGREVPITSDDGRWIFPGKVLVLRAAAYGVAGECTLSFVLDGKVYSIKAVAGQDAPVIGDAENNGVKLSEALAEMTGWYATGVRFQGSDVADQSLSWTSEDLVADGKWTADRDMRFIVDVDNAYTVVLWDNGRHVANVEARYGEPFSVPGDCMIDDPLFTGYVTDDGTTVVGWDGRTVRGVDGITDGEGRWALASNLDLYTSIGGASGEGGEPAVEHTLTFILEGSEYTIGATAGGPAPVIGDAEKDGVSLSEALAAMTGRYATGVTFEGAPAADGSLEWTSGDLVSNGRWKADEDMTFEVGVASSHIVTLWDGGGAIAELESRCGETLAVPSEDIPDDQHFPGYATIGGIVVVDGSGTPVPGIDGITDSEGRWILDEDIDLYGVVFTAEAVNGGVVVTGAYYAGSATLAPCKAALRISPAVTAAAGSSDPVRYVPADSGSAVMSLSFYADHGSRLSATSVEILEGIPSIGEEAFQACETVTSVTIPSTVTSIDACAFCTCHALVSVDIPESVTSICDSAFEDCYLLESFDLSSVESIGEWAFLGCDSITSLTIPDSVKSIGDRAFEECEAMETVTLPASIEELGEEIFWTCVSLETAVFSEGSTIIGEYMFEECSALTSVVIPDTMESIGEGAFSYCSSLESIVIPASVEDIGDWAFEGCDALASVTFEGGSTSIESDAFDGDWGYGNPVPQGTYILDGSGTWVKSTS